MKSYESNNDVVWVYIAKSGSDYASRNWILCGQWIKSSLNPEYRPVTWEIEENGYYWHPSNSFSIDADYYQKYTVDEKTALSYFKESFDTYKKIVDEIEETFKKSDIVQTIKVLKENKGLVTELHTQKDLPLTSNPKLSDFLNVQYDIAIYPIQDLFYLENPSSTQIGNKLKEAKEIIKKFDDGLSFWTEKLGLTEDEYKTIISKRKNK